jgi:hypothetical protein
MALSTGRSGELTSVGARIQFINILRLGRTGDRTADEQGSLLWYLLGRCAKSMLGIAARDRWGNVLMIRSRSALAV